MVQSFEAWWASNGPITKFFIIAPLVVVFSWTFGLVSPALLVTNFDELIYKGQFWRLITSIVFLGKLDMAFMFNLAMMVMWTKRHEEEDFQGKFADHLWMLTVLITTIQLSAFCCGLFRVSFPFISALIWIWCRRHEDAVLSLYMFSFKAAVFAWVMCVFHLVIGRGFMDDVFGILAGHFFFFLTDIVPKTHGYSILKTPQFYYNMWPNQRLGATTIFSAPSSRGALQGQARPVAHRCGTGRSLGGAGNDQQQSQGDKKND